MHKQFFKAWLSEEISKKRSKKGIELMLENSKSVSFAQMDLGLVMELLEQLIMVEQLIKLFIFIVLQFRCVSYLKFSLKYSIS